MASFAEYSCNAAMAFSADDSCETPTIALRMRIVRIYAEGHCQIGCLYISSTGSTYNCRIHKRRPALSLLEQRKHERYRCRTEENYDELVLELLQHELPQRRGWVLRDCWSSQSVDEHVDQSLGDLPFRPCFSLDAITACSERPLDSVALKWASTSCVERT